jgi:hypothetical protein
MAEHNALGEFGMTGLLQRAIAEIEKLPAEEQDAVASRILADLEDDAAWSARFEATSTVQWDRLADLARQEIASGDTVPLEDIFPFRAIGSHAEYDDLLKGL